MKNFFVISFLFFSFLSYNQELPAFMLEIQKDKPNFFTVEKLYKEYAEEYKENNPKSIDLENQEREEFKNPYEKQYIEWIRLNKQYINEQGFIIKPTSQEFQKEFNRSARQARAVNATTQANYNSDIPYHTTFDGWSYDGPLEIRSSATGKETPFYSNIRAFAQSKSNPDFLYSAAEGTSLFVSRDKGNTWHYATKGYTGMNEITAIGVSPIDEYYACAGSYNGIFITRDGGVTWQLLNEIVYTNSYIIPSEVNDVSKILITNKDNNSNNDFILIASKRGIFRVTFNGSTYSFKHTLGLATADIVQKPGSPNVFYALSLDQSLNYYYFYESTDSGLTWVRKGQNNGWYNPQTSTPISNVQGGRLGVTPANPNVVYAYMQATRTGIIQENAAKNFLGIFKSNDSGNSWTLPNPQGLGDGEGWQGFYNCAIMVNPKNENELIYGGFNAQKSIDGAKIFNYIGGRWGEADMTIHPDMQTFYTQINNDGTVDSWITTDGGINYSTDFFTNREDIKFKNKGLSANYWGFDIGENTGNYVGGSYHNGDKYYHENFPKGSNYHVGGSEEATGYVLSDYDERYMSTYFSTFIASSDYNNISDFRRTGNGNINPKPYESIDPVPYNNKDYNGNYYYVTRVDVFGMDRYKLYKNSGKVNQPNSSFLIDTPANAKVYSYVVDFYNPSIQYLYLENSKLYVSNDEGKTWVLKTSPFGNGTDIFVYIAIDGVNPNKIYALRRNAYYDFLRVSTDQGQTWQDITVPNAPPSFYKHIQTVRGIANTYFLVSDKNQKGNYSKVYYFYDNKWVDYSENLPTDIGTLKLKIHYKKGKLYLPTHGLGVWTSDLPKPINDIIKQVKLNISSDINKTYKIDYQFKFTDKSTVISKNIVEYKWRFPGSSSVINGNTKNPLVQYNKVGIFSVELQLTDDKGQSYKEIFPNYVTIKPLCDCSPAAIINNRENIKVWFDASNYKNGKIYDKLSGVEYTIENSQDTTIETAPEFNNQLVFKFKDGANANIQLGKMYEGKTLFIVNSLSQNSTANFSFLFGGTGDFHSEKSTIFSPYWISDSNRYNLSQGGLTQINGINKDFFTTAQQVKPTLYTIRTANLKNAAQFNSISRDRTWNERSWQGKIAEVLIFDKQLTDAEVQEINKYLMNKYNIK